MSRRKQMLDDLNQDIQEHLEREIEDNLARGMSPEKARSAALRKFGNVLRVKEDTRAVWTMVWLEQLKQDVSFALRILRKSPGFTVVVILTLALAIGANAVVFSVMNGLVLRPLNVPQPDSLYEIERTSDFSAAISYPDYLDLRDRNRSFEDLAAYNIDKVAFDTGDGAASAWAIAVTGNYFDVLGIPPHLGRVFHPSDEHGPDSAPYMVLSYAYWNAHFHGDPGVIGRVVLVNKHPFTVVGVSQPGFMGTLLFISPDFFVPIVNSGQLSEGVDMNARGSRWVFDTLGHLKAGVTTEQAAADINALYGELERTYPKEHMPSTYKLARPSLYGDFMGRPIRAFLTALMLLALLILVGACANLGSLFAARASDRSREVALRLALGAGPWRILRQLLTEAVLISTIGGAVGLWASVVLLRWMATWEPLSRYPLHLPVAPDANVYATALLLAVVSGLLFGAVPLRQVMQTDPYGVIKSGTRTTSARRVTLRDVLLVVQIAICGVLVTSSLVAVRGLVRSLHTDFGFNPRNTMLVETTLSMAGYNVNTAPPIQKKMIDAMATIPGVTTVGLVDAPPLASADWKAVNIYTDQTTDLRPANAFAHPLQFLVSPEYFEAAGTRLLSGRVFTWHDDKNAPAVAIVNQEFARKMFGSVGSAVGSYFKLRDGTRAQVVGIAEDGRYMTFTEAPKVVMFLPVLQNPSTQTSLVLRSNLDPQQLAMEVKNKLRELDPGLPSFIQTWTQGLEFPSFPARVAAIALGILGAMGAMLSITGIFGLAAYQVSKRMRELGIRMALGARRKEVLEAALGRAMKVLAFGSTAGLALGLLATRVLAVIVYGATPRDPLVLSGAVVSMMLLGLMATWIPAQRALSIDPAMLLREE